MSILYKDCSKETLVKIFSESKSIQEDIKDMMELSFPDVSPNYSDKLDYFIHECESGAYAHSELINC